MARKVLLIISGILKSIAGAGLLIIGGLIFIINGSLKAMYSKAEDALNEFVDIMVGIDEKAYGFLLEYNMEQVLDYVMSFVSKVGIVILILAVLVTLFAVLTFLIMKNKIVLNQGTKIIFIISMLICTLVFSISNVLTIIALCLGNKHKNKNKNDNITQNDGLDSIPEYHIS